MRHIICEIHGKMEAILIDAILLRYKCKKCLKEEKERFDFKERFFRYLFQIL